MNIFIPVTLIFMNLAFAFEETEGMKAMRIGCDKQKLARGCFNYANFLLKNNQDEASTKYFDKGCKWGDEASCKKERWGQKSDKTEQKSPELVPQKEKVIVASKDEIRQKKINEAIKSCTTLTEVYPHPMIAGFQVEEKIIGMKDGFCLYSQSMPNNGLVVCKLKEQQREAFEGVENLLNNQETCQISNQ